AGTVQTSFYTPEVRDRASERDKRTNRPPPRATRIATDSRYGEARSPWAVEVPSSPVVRANRPAIEAANAKAAIRPTFNRTGKATPYAREARASGSRPAGSHMKFAITPMPIAIARPRNPIDRKATSRTETGAPVLLGPGK